MIIVSLLSIIMNSGDNFSRALSKHELKSKHTIRNLFAFTSDLCLRVKKMFPNAKIIAGHMLSILSRALIRGDTSLVPDNFGRMQAEILSTFVAFWTLDFMAGEFSNK